ncbi:MAG: tyrosine-type recombinase/integrase [Bacteroidales bacterium]|nr:tyrosine-type recombinase/integrase [Candidatus Physcocola equi]
MFIDEFLQYIKYEKAYSSHTFISYQTDMKQFAAFVEQQKGRFDPTEISAYDIREWLLQLMNGGLSARSTSRKVATLNTFFGYLKKKGTITANPMDKVSAPKVQKRLPVYLHEKQMSDLLNPEETGELFPDTFEGKRDKLMIEMFYNLGIRLSELISIKDKDIDFNRQTILITGKRNKQRYIPFGNSLKSDILAFESDRDADVAREDDRLFTRADGKPLYRMLVYRVVNKYLEQVCTLTKKSPHVLRHTFATAMLNNGADIDAVKELLGHASLSATEVYTHTTFDRLRKIYKQAHPRA